MILALALPESHAEESFAYWGSWGDFERLQLGALKDELHPTLQRPKMYPVVSGPCMDPYGGRLLTIRSAKESKLQIRSASRQTCMRGIAGRLACMHNKGEIRLQA